MYRHKTFEETKHILPWAAAAVSKACHTHYTHYADYYPSYASLFIKS